jgi:hypothetical protein
MQIFCPKGLLIMLCIINNRPAESGQKFDNPDAIIEDTGVPVSPIMDYY